nr:YetF domain-containing protein [Paenibacillus sp. yr247]
MFEDSLKKERYAGDELLEQLRTKSIFRVAEV